jgi:hypothetical protein
MIYGSKLINSGHFSHKRATSMATVESIVALIADIKRLRAQHGFRARTLVPDLALLGLSDDLVDSSEAALEVLAGSHPYRAYMMARVAFEAAQRLLVLATAGDFIRLATRAWLFYQEKDGNLEGRAGSEPSTSAKDQILSLWEKYYADARALVEEECHFLERTQRPDNFLRRNLAAEVETAYVTLAESQRISGRTLREFLPTN